MKIIPSKKSAPLLAFLSLPAVICSFSRAAEAQANLPPPSIAKIDFNRDIRPIFETSCLRCHGPEKPRSHFRLDDRGPALNGGDNNTNDIVPGDSSKSLLVNYVVRQVPDMEMPPPGKGDPLTPAQISLLRAWIDQGANWGTNSKPVLAFELAPTLRWIDVHGNQSKFRELEGVNSGFSGGADEFSFTSEIKPGEKISLTGHAIVPNQDLEVKLDADKSELGFIRAGFDEWRQYYNDFGGYDPVVVPSEFNLNRDLHVDNGRAWVDFGLTLPRQPQVVLGYEYQFRDGSQSMLDWGYANGKAIYPASLAVDEHTHIIKLDVAHDIGGWHLENNARLEFYSEKNDGAEAQIIFGGASPNTFVTTRDNYHSTQGMNTLTLEKQIRDWWLLSGGFYYSKLDGVDVFNQTTAIPAFSFDNQLASTPITLRRQSEVFSVASLFTPLEYLTFSLGTQNEWTREDGFGDSVPDLELLVNAPAGSDTDLFKSSQNAGVRFTKIPFTVFFADARFDQESVNQSQEEGPAEFANRTEAMNYRYDLQTGFNLSPWRWLALNAQYQHQSSDTGYNQAVDVFDGIPGPTNGYPGFILDRKIRTDKFETKLEVRPATWLKTALTCRIADTDYSSTTDPAFDFDLSQAVSPGGEILDGRYQEQSVGLNVTLTPFRRLYFSSAFTYGHSRVVTADNADPSIAPYNGNVYTLTTTATYELNLKTSLQVSYAFSCAGYGENNAAAGVPLGLDFTRHELLAGLTRQLTKNLSGSLRYQFSQYSEPGSSNQDFTAHGIFAVLAYKWP